jgi:small nuclear ribonucleoprotein (snRNP)-like protein
MDQTAKESKLKSWLGKDMKITITDGRLYEGKFQCIDNHGNIILTNTSQILSPQGPHICTYFFLTVSAN